MKKLMLILLKEEQGMTLIETLIGMGIISVMAVVFLMSMSTTSKAIMISQERVTAENLAKSQMEYIRSQTYDAENSPPQYLKLPTEDIPANYDVTVSAERLDPEADGTGDDDGLQQLTVVVTKTGSELYRLEGYRMNR